MEKLGIEPLLAYEYTPYEIKLLANNYEFKAKERLKQNIIQAFYIESLARTKRLPKLNKVLKDIEKPHSNTKGDYILKRMAKEKGVKL